MIIFLFFVIGSFPQQQMASLGDFLLVNGKTIKNFELGYRTFGQINKDSSNIIFYASWFGGTSEAIGTLIKKYSFIDTSKYFVIAVDAIGNGISSSPSNFNSSESFPEITIQDMTTASVKFLRDKLKIKNIFAAIGGSMGSMQVLQLAVDYPDFSDKVIAYVSSPRLTTYDMLWIQTQLNFIETAKKYSMTEKEIKKISDMITALISRTPEYIITNTQVEKFQEYLKTFDKEPSKIFTLENYLCQIKAIYNHNIAKNFGNSIEEASKRICAEIFFIVSENDMMVNPSESIKLADLTDSDILILDNNCGHLSVSCEIEKCRDAIADFLD
jgi:homoserine O-acetyltransferase